MQIQKKKTFLKIEESSLFINVRVTAFAKLVRWFHFRTLLKRATVSGFFTFYDTTACEFSSPFEEEQFETGEHLDTCRDEFWFQSVPLCTI